MSPRWLLLLLSLATPSFAKVVWRGDFETGNLSQYTRTQMVSPDRLKVVQSPLRQGKYALKATVRQGDDPIGASGNRNELVYTSNEPAGSEYYYKWSTQFAPNYPSAKTWQLFAQWHHYGCCGSPPVQFVVNGETMYLSSVGTTVWSAPLVRGKWLDFVFHVKWSPKAKVGFIEMWLNGKLVVPKRYVATQFPGQVNYLKVGLYRNSTIVPEGVVFHDGWMQATTLEDVIPTATTTTTTTTTALTETAEPPPESATSSSVEAAPVSPAPQETDVGAPEDVVEPELEETMENRAAGCQSTPASSMPWLGLVAFWLRRRRNLNRSP